LGDLILKPSPEEEAKEKRRYELDVPPVEEERHVYWKSRPDRSVNKNLIRVELFEELKTKNKETFEMSLEVRLIFVKIVKIHFLCRRCLQSETSTCAVTLSSFMQH
jgi:hypothetical protein